MEQARERQRQFEETQRRWQEQMQIGATSNNATAEVRNGIILLFKNYWLDVELQ